MAVIAIPTATNPATSRQDGVIAQRRRRVAAETLAWASNRITASPSVACKQARMTTEMGRGSHPFKQWRLQDLPGKVEKQGEHGQIEFRRCNQRAQVAGRGGFHEGQRERTVPTARYPVPQW